MKPQLRVALLASCAAVAVVPALSDAGDSGKWRKVSVDSRSPEDEGAAFGLSSEGRKALLELRCGRGAAEARIRWVYFLGESPSAVTARFGKEAPQTTNGPLPADHSDTLFPGNAADFIDRLRTVDTLAVRVVPYSMSQRRPMSFDLQQIVMDDPPSSCEPKVLASAPSKALTPVTEIFDLRGLDEVPPSIDAGCGVR